MLGAPTTAYDLPALIPFLCASLQQLVLIPQSNRPVCPANLSITVSLEHNKQLIDHLLSILYQIKYCQMQLDSHLVTPNIHSSKISKIIRIQCYDT